MKFPIRNMEVIHIILIQNIHTSKKDKIKLKKNKIYEMFMQSMQSIDSLIYFSSMIEEKPHIVP